MRTYILAGIASLLVSVIILQGMGSDEHIRTYLDKSVPFLGTDTPRMDGIDGDGIVIAVIDTGVDHNHPDLSGWGSDGKIIGGYNFIDEDELPIDTNGHGTQVAGVIAADGQIVGVAPKAKILAYKVSEDGKGVASDLIVRAIDMAIKDGADIINISLGVNKTNTKIEQAVNRALGHGIFVVTAAGNDGPDARSIGSPGTNRDSVTVGASYNNLASNLVATLEVDGRQYVAIPMVGSPELDSPITSEIVPAGHASARDLEGMDITGRIILAERGSADESLLYFSEKERNAADAGAVALIVYNDSTGLFLGELTHEFTTDDYSPRIPVVSVDRKDGLEIRDALAGSGKGTLHLFYNPDFVAHFSSRGPVSPFYIKPDIVAPGAYINTTQNNAGYNFTSGTSYAAPHVSGAAALLLQKNPEIHHGEIKALLLTTAERVSDAYGNEFSVNDSGAGRLDIAEAFNARLVIQPPSLAVSMSSFEPETAVSLSVRDIGSIQGDMPESLGKVTASFAGPEFIEFAYSLREDGIGITLGATGEQYGTHEGKIGISHGDTHYTVPVIIHYTEGRINASLQDDRLLMDIGHPEEWSFAKITVTDSLNGKKQTVSATPKKPASVTIQENSEYWVEARIRVDGDTHNAYDMISVDSLYGNTDGIYDLDIPGKQIGIISGIVLVIGITGMAIQRRR